ncbi:SpoIIIAH-like family protein [Alicyclobacillus fodiniaquatilis]|uniref:SpoIIIAH-like family protein n=1 Tax=Alicyclobacillus fodiniaquatilis TaxID=1661150 RepID=A0ABW4JF45_9BACL
MVKRQTVWLSTMMVLSLMLIGYYTMNNQTSPASSTADNQSISTAAVNPPANDTSNSSTSDTKKNTAPSSKTSKATSSDVTTTSASDFFTNTETSVEQQLSEQESNLKAEMTNTKASDAQITKASNQLQKLQSLDGGMDYAIDAIKADGYKSAVIVPDNNQEKFTVWVEANSLQKDDAIKIMNIVSQQLDISMLDISVKAHA